MPCTVCWQSLTKNNSENDPRINNLSLIFYNFPGGACPAPSLLVSSLTLGGVTSQIVDKRTYVLLVNEACVLVELNAKITPELTIKSLIFKIIIKYVETVHCMCTHVSTCACIQML